MLYVIRKPGIPFWITLLQSCIYNNLSSLQILILLRCHRNKDQQFGYVSGRKATLKWTLWEKSIWWYLGVYAGFTYCCFHYKVRTHIKYLPFYCVLVCLVTGRTCFPLCCKAHKSLAWVYTEWHPDHFFWEIFK